MNMLASLFADPARCGVLPALNDGRALPASVLADEAGVSRSTASSHLAKPAGAGLLTVQSQGRHRYYRLAGPEIADPLERLGRLAPAQPVRSLREGHQGGQASIGPHLLGPSRRQTGGGADGQPARPWRPGRRRPPLRPAAAPPRLAEQPRPRRGLSPDDRRARPLLRRRHRLPSGTRPLVLYCVDWTEQRHHLSGGLGCAVLDGFVSGGWVKREPRGRAMTITDRGRTALAECFGIEWTG